MECRHHKTWLGPWKEENHTLIKDEFLKRSLFCFLPASNRYCVPTWAPKSLQMVTAAIKLKDTCSLEENL